MAESLEGRYANYFEVGFTEYEIILDFGQFDSESQSGVRHSRMILNPQSAKVFLSMLQELMTKYAADVEGNG